MFWSSLTGLTAFCWQRTRPSSASVTARRWPRSFAPTAAPHMTPRAREEYCACGCPPCGIGPGLRRASGFPACSGGRRCTLFIPGVPAARWCQCFLFLNACLICVFINPGCWVFGDYIFAEFCSVEVNNQSGKTLRVTPIDADNPYSAVRLYRENLPSFLTYQQRNISVNPART